MMNYKRGSLILLVILMVSAPLFSQNFNYADALQKSIFFYEANQSGPLPDWNRVEFRGDSALDDGSDVGMDLSGGWYDAGDHVKFGFPMAASVTTIAWGAINYRDGFEQTGQMDELLLNLRFVNDYFIKCHVISGGQTQYFYGQVGSGSTDHSYWGSSEVMTMERPSYAISPSAPGSDLAAETAAALASSSILFRLNDSAYADELLYHARILYTFADNYRGEYDSSISDANAFYHSYNGYIDELAWGAYWLYKALIDSGPSEAANYLAMAESFYAEYNNLIGTTPEHREYAWTHNWNDKYFALSVVLAIATGNSLYMDNAEKNLDWWTVGCNGEQVAYTPGGLARLDNWGPTRYASNAALLAFIYSDWVSDATLKDRYSSFAKSQIDYILGDNPQNYSYMIGFGSNYPHNPHHRNAHGSWVADINIPEESRHILYGAIVGGPDASDNYSDDRSDYERSEVACDYNAALLGNLAKLCMEQGTYTTDHNFPLPEVRTVDELSVQAKCNANGTWGYQPMVRILNQTSWPPRVTNALSARYFFTLESGKSISDITLQDNGGASAGVVQGPYQYSDNTYYVLLDLSSVGLAPNGHSNYYVDIYFTLNDSTNSFDETNDYSATGLTSTETPTQYIPLYENDTLVWGSEPGGSTSTTTSTGGPDYTLGDVDDDGSITIVDALLIAQRYVGLDPAGFTAPAEAGDVDEDGQISIVDALLVAQYYVGIIDQLPPI